MSDHVKMHKKVTEILDLLAKDEDTPAVDDAKIVSGALLAILGSMPTVEALLTYHGIENGLRKTLYEHVKDGLSSDDKVEFPDLEWESKP